MEFHTFYRPYSSFSRHPPASKFVETAQIIFLATQNYSISECLINKLCAEKAFVKTQLVRLNTLAMLYKTKFYSSLFQNLVYIFAPPSHATNAFAAKNRTSASVSFVIVVKHGFKVVSTTRVSTN